MSKAEEYRQVAQQCLAMASSVSTDEVRTALIERAKHWHRLAQQQDHSTDLAKTPTRPVQPMK
jgi:hypothetical protein